MGPADEVVRHYMATSFRKQSSDLSSMRLRGYGADVRFRSIDMDAQAGYDIPFNAPLQFDLVVEADKANSGLSLGASIFDPFGACVGTLFSPETFAIEAGQTRRLKLAIHEPKLVPGQYYTGFGVGRGGMASGRHDLDVVIGQPTFQILPVSQTDDVIAQWNPNWGRIAFVDNQVTVE